MSAMASNDHSWDSCPNKYAVPKFRVGDIDLDKQSHFYHDNAGCPFACADNHNHPRRVE